MTPPHFYMVILVPILVGPPGLLLVDSPLRSSFFLRYAALHVTCSVRYCNIDPKNPASHAEMRFNRCKEGLETRMPSCLMSKSPRSRPIAVRARGSLVNGIVSVLTESLRAAGVGKSEYEQLVSSEQQAKKRAPPRKGDLREVSRRISQDFTRNAYIITGCGG